MSWKVGCYIKGSAWIMAHSASGEHKNVHRFKTILLVAKDEKGDSWICGQVYYLSASQNGA